MKYHSRKARPATGMEMTVTLSLPAEATVEASAAALVQFMLAVGKTSREIVPAWIRIHCSGIPSELEKRMQGAFDKMKKRPQLRLVINNRTDQ